MRPASAPLQVGINFLLLLYRSKVSGAILADEMGLGKTAQLITYLGARLGACWAVGAAGGGPDKCCTCCVFGCWWLLCDAHSRIASLLGSCAVLRPLQLPC